MRSSQCHCIVEWAQLCPVSKNVCLNSCSELAGLKTRGHLYNCVQTSCSPFLNSDLRQIAAYIKSIQTTTTPCTFTTCSPFLNSDLKQIYGLLGGLVTSTTLSNYWSISGNAVGSNTAFIGTTDNYPFNLKTNSLIAVTINTNQNVTFSNKVAIGSTVAPTTTLNVNGNTLFTHTVAGLISDFRNDAQGVNYIRVRNDGSFVNSATGYEVYTNASNIGRFIGQSTSVTLANSQLGIAGSAFGLTGNSTPIAFAPNGISALTNAMVINTLNCVGINSGSLATLPATLSVYGTMNVSGTTTLNNLGTSRIGTTQIAGVLTGTATLDFPSTAAGAVSDLTLTVTGAVNGDAVSLGTDKDSMQPAGSFFAWISGTNIATVRFVNNALITAYDPNSGVFKVTVIKN